MGLSYLTKNSSAIISAIERSAKFGGDIIFNSIKEFEESYKKGGVHPADLKDSVSRELNEIIKPLREHFEKPKYKRLLNI